MASAEKGKDGSPYEDPNWYANKFNGNAKAGEAVFEAYKMAMDVRKFEIELYWKRAAYFWAFIVLAFGAYGATLTARTINPIVQSDALFISACIGTVLAVALYFVNRGSKFWQRNWEYQVDLLENKAMGPLYKHVFAKELDTFWNLTSAYPFSVSNINTILSMFFICVFALLAGINSGLDHASTAALSWPKILLTVLSALAIARLYKDGHTNAMKQRPKTNTQRVQKADVHVYYSVRDVHISKGNEPDDSAAA
jgi:hypothetical protein